MNKPSLFLATLLGAAAISAQAGELYSPQQFQDPASTLTRAQVKQTVLQERKTGELDHNDVDLPGNGTLMTPTDAFDKTRATAKSEVLAARAKGELAHNDVDLPNVATGTSQLTRQQVRAEAIAARQLTKTAPGRNTIEY
jgi:hypothetical protein